MPVNEGLTWALFAQSQSEIPVRAVPLIQVPILFIHGLADSQVPYRNSQALLAAARNAADQLWLVPGADHVKSFKMDPRGYWDHVLPFLASALR